MSKDISSSSSSDEDEDHSPEPQPSQDLKGKQSVRYQCPADFVPFCYKPCSSALKTNNNKELWLIKAPSNFNPQCFSGVQLPLCGLQTVMVPSDDGKEHIYSVMGSSRCNPELRLLNSHQNPSHTSTTTTLAPPFAGLINICENYGDSSANQAPQVIPATSAPTLPPGLKQRFQHFSSKTSVITLQAGEEERDKGKRKRKRKMDKNPELKEFSIRTEAGKLQLPMDGEGSEESRKKRKKAHREGQSVEKEIQTASVFVKTEVMVKNEPLDTGFGDEVEGKKKKKKKKKKCKSED